jgi:putative hydrolase of the HAD superfamily
MEDVQWTRGSVIFDLDGTLLDHVGSVTTKLKAVGLHGQLGPVFTAEALGAAKPDPRTFLAVCDVLAVEPESATNVGDLYDLDMLAPREAGLHAVYLDRQDAGPYDEPCRITSLRQLPGQLHLDQG